jgi:hypothetical protein
LDDSCGDSGCEVEWLMSDRVEVDEDPAVFAQQAVTLGWGDGLPLVPPTIGRVRSHIKGSGRRGERSLGDLPPSGQPCTVENLAVNAVMAGTRAVDMPLLCAVVEAMVDPLAYTHGASTTTNAVTQAMVVSGPVRHELTVPMSYGCLGGEAGPGPAIGRAIRLVLRNVGGERVGVSSQSTFGQPGRITGILFGEREEDSPWPSFGQRRGMDGSAVTVLGVAGTTSISDTSARTGRDLLEMIGRSLAYPAQATIISQHGGELMLLINPAWAHILAMEVGSFETVREQIWQEASVARDLFPAVYQPFLDLRGLFDAKGNVRVLGHPEDLQILVCGGDGAVHAMALPGYGPSRAVTRSVSGVPASA